MSLSIPGPCTMTMSLRTTTGIESGGRTSAAPWPICHRCYREILLASRHDGHSELLSLAI